MRNLAKQIWPLSCILGAVGAYAYLHVQSRPAEMAMPAETLRFNRLQGANPIATDQQAITGDPNVRKCICKLWQVSGYGFRPTEAGMDIVRSKDGTLSCRFWPFTHYPRAANPPENWPGSDVVAAAHTHPRKGAIQYPSDPYDYKDAVDDYVVCADGIFTAAKGCARKKDKKPCTLQSAGSDWHKQWCE